MRAFLVSVAFLVGVAARTLLPIGLSVAELLALIACATALLSIWNRRAFFLLATGICIAGSLGIIRADVVLTRGISPLSALVEQQVQIEGIVSDEPDIRDTSTLLTIDVVSLAGVPFSVHDKVLAVMAPYTAYEYGEKVTLRGKLEQPKVFDTDTGRVFDYPGYLAVSGIDYTMFHPELTAVSSGNGNPVLAFLFNIKHFYLSGIARSLPEPESALAGGITVGDKRSLGEKLLTDFRNAGVVHVVVLSGYNMTIVAQTILWFLSALPLRVGIFGGMLGIVAFALMTGGGASIVRASIMAILALLAHVVHRSYVMTRALLLAIVGMVAWNPLVLVYDPGFQLSVLATIGLIYVSPHVESRLGWISKRFGLREIISATLGTQLTVLPFLLYQMGTFSLVALPVNLLVLSVMPLAMLLSLIAAVVGFLFPPLALYLSLPAYVVLAYVIGVVEVSVQIPFAAITVPAFPVWVLISTYTIIFSLIALMYRKYRKVDGRVH